MKTSSTCRKSEVEIAWETIGLALWETTKTVGIFAVLGLFVVIVSSGPEGLVALYEDTRPYYIWAAFTLYFLSVFIGPACPAPAVVWTITGMVLAAAH